jgi:hypothetical protein
MNSIEWFISVLAHNDILDHKKVSSNKQLYNLYLRLKEQAKEMHKQEIIDAWNGGDYAYFYSKETGRDFADGNDYYQETFVSKGSGECPFFISLTKTTSATICSACGKEKFLHKT